MREQVWKRLKIAALIVAGLAGIGILGGVGGGSIDPTDPGNFNFVRVVNDLQSAIEIHECDDPRCDRWTVGPGEGQVLQVAWGGAERIPLTVLITGRSACVLLDEPKKVRPSPTARLSSLPACSARR